MLLWRASVELHRVHLPHVLCGVRQQGKLQEILVLARLEVLLNQLRTKPLSCEESLAETMWWQVPK